MYMRLDTYKKDIKNVLVLKIGCNREDAGIVSEKILQWVQVCFRPYTVNVINLFTTLITVEIEGLGALYVQDDLDVLDKRFINDIWIEPKLNLQDPADEIVLEIE